MLVFCILQIKRQLQTIIKESFYPKKKKKILSSFLLLDFFFVQYNFWAFMIENTYLLLKKNISFFSFQFTIAHFSPIFYYWFFESLMSICTSYPIMNIESSRNIFINFLWKIIKLKVF